MLAVVMGASVLLGLGEIWALLIGGVVGAFALRGTGWMGSRSASALVPILFLQTAPGTAASVAGGVSLWKLFLFFLKVGSVLYGSGYVLVAFLEGGLVDEFGWLTQGELLDAIAIGQFTPGPVLSTATFVGYLVLGAAGAAVATAGIFLPSFAFVGALNPLVPKLRHSAWLSAFLDAVNASAVALMLAVTIQLGADVLVAWPAWVIAGLAALAVLRFKLSAVWVVVGGAVLGFLLSFAA